MLKSIIKKLLIIVVTIFALFLMVRCHVIRHYHDTIHVRLMPPMPPDDTIVYNLNSRVSIDAEVSKIFCAFSIFPCDTVLLKDSLYIRYGDVEKNLSIRDFWNASDTLKYECSFKFKDSAPWSAYKFIRARVFIDNFTSHQFICNTELEYVYPFVWVCHNMYSSGKNSMEAGEDRESVRCYGNGDVRCSIVLENPQRTMINTFIVVLLSMLIGSLIPKLYE